MAPDVVLLCLDGLDDRYLREYAGADGAFASLERSGASGRLESTFPPFTPVAWPTAYTGADPAETDVFSFFSFGDGPDDRRVIDRRDVDAPALWEYASERGKRSVVVNLPVTHPVEDADAVIRPGFLAPADAPTSPPDLVDRIEDALGEPYPVYAADWRPDADADGAYFAAWIDLQTRVAEWLLENEPSDFFAFTLQVTDTVFHVCDDPADFRAVYRAADEFVAAVRDRVGDETTVVVCSDHGMQRREGYTVYVNELLADAGYVETTTGAPPAAFMDEVQSLREGNGGGERDRRRTVDWETSTAYLRTPTELGVCVDAGGGVYERTRREVAVYLRGLETPDGDPVFEWVRPREAVYDGPHAADAPDVVFAPTEWRHVPHAAVDADARFAPSAGYEHRPHGVFRCAGPSIASETVTDASLRDLAPTVLHLLGLPIPEGLAGDVLVDDGAPVAREPYAANARSSGERDRREPPSGVEERLADLGYIDRGD
jgi:predicted AlkP superfamily phosphohydrolase/phosphomutase